MPMTQAETPTIANARISLLLTLSIISPANGANTMKLTLKNNPAILERYFGVVKMAENVYIGLSEG